MRSIRTNLALASLAASRGLNAIAAQLLEDRPPAARLHLASVILLSSLIGLAICSGWIVATWRGV